MSPTPQSGGALTAERHACRFRGHMSPEQSGTDNARGQRLPRSARRAQLLEAAQAAFVESGYHAAAMDDIAERAGVSKPVLYQHFPGKLELYLALLDKHSEGLELLVREALASTHDNKERVYASIARLLRLRLARRRRLPADLRVRPDQRVRGAQPPGRRRPGLRRGGGRGHRRGHRPARRGRLAARHGADRAGPGQRPALARAGLGRAQGRGGTPGRHPRLARPRVVPEGGRGRFPEHAG